MFWYKDKREKAENELAEQHAAVLRRLREVIDYRPEAPDSAMTSRQAPPSRATAAYQGQQS